LQIIKEELKANLRLESPKQAPLAYQEGTLIGTYVDLAERLPFSFQKVWLKRCQHYLDTCEDVCGLIGFLKKHGAISNRNDLKIFVRAFNMNMNRVNPVCNGEGDVSEAASRTITCNLEFDVLSTEKQRDLLAYLQDAVTSGRLHPAFTSMDECKAVLRMLTRGY